MGGSSRLASASVSRAAPVRREQRPATPGCCGSWGAWPRDSPGRWSSRPQRACTPALPRRGWAFPSAGTPWGPTPTPAASRVSPAPPPGHCRPGWAPATPSHRHSAAAAPPSPTCPSAGWPALCCAAGLQRSGGDLSHEEYMQSQREAPKDLAGVLGAVAGMALLLAWGNTQPGTAGDRNHIVAPA